MFCGIAPEVKFRRFFYATKGFKKVASCPFSLLKSQYHGTRLQCSKIYVYICFMRRWFEILSSSLKIAMLELWKNKLRTFLSLLGVTIGIFCVIGVLATVNSLEYNLQSEIKSLGTNFYSVDKWDFSSAGDGNPQWWKYVNRPLPKRAEAKMIKERTPSVAYSAFTMSVVNNVDAGGNTLSNIKIYGISDDFSLVQPVEINDGRSFLASEFELGRNVALIGDEVAEKLFGTPQRAIGKSINIFGKRLNIIGTIKKQGAQMFGGWGFDVAVLLPYKFARNIMDETTADAEIIVRGKENFNHKTVKEDLIGTMRAIRKLSPTEEDNFSVNDINDLSNLMNDAFVSINVGGWAIAGLSLVVGMFGVANIMFVTVKERTAQIGLKKAIGAKSNLILIEFLMESAFLSIVGGLIGLLLVFALTEAITQFIGFPIFISTNNIIIAFSICILVGILAGIIPAMQAAKLNPVEAIRG